MFNYISPDELLEQVGKQLEQANTLLEKEQWADGSLPSSKHNIQRAQTHALVAIGLLLLKRVGEV